MLKSQILLIMGSIFRLQKRQLRHNGWPDYAQIWQGAPVDNQTSIPGIRLKKAENSIFRSTSTWSEIFEVKVKVKVQGHTESALDSPKLWANLEVSTMICSKVMTDYVFFTFCVTLTLTFDLEPSTTKLGRRKTLKNV